MAIMFQSTLPWWERLRVFLYLNVNTECFNPRSRGGSDDLRLSRGFTVTGFNPRSRGGSDPSQPNRWLFYVCFNPRSRGGSDVKINNHVSCVRVFQSTLPWWERRLWLVIGLGL